MSNWVLLLCVFLLLVQVPLSYYSLDPILGNDLEVHIAQTKQIDGFFHTWWSTDGIGGNLPYLHYPPVILLFSWSTLLLKISHLLILLVLPIAFNSFIQLMTKRQMIAQIAVLLFTYLLLDRTHLPYYPGIGGLIMGLFSFNLATLLFFIYWQMLLLRKNSPLLLGLIVLTNPIVGIVAALVTLCYLPWYKSIWSGVVSFSLSAWWLIPYYVYSRSFGTQFGTVVTESLGAASAPFFGFMRDVILTTHTLPLLFFALPGLFYAKGKRLYVLLGLLLVLIAFRVLRLEYRLSFFLFVIAVIFSVFFFERFPLYLFKFLYGFVLLLVLYVAFVSAPFNYQDLTNVYDNHDPAPLGINTDYGYYLNYNPPLTYHAAGDTRIAFTPFTRSKVSGAFKQLSVDFIARDFDELYPLYKYFHITHAHAALVDVESPTVQKVANTNIASIAIDRYPVLVSDAAYDVEILAPMSGFERYSYFANALNTSDCIESYKQKRSIIAMETSCVGVPHVLKLTYHPLWKIKGANEFREYGGHYTVFVPNNAHVKLKLGPSWWMYILYVVGVLALLLILIHMYYPFFKRK